MDLPNADENLESALKSLLAHDTTKKISAKSNYFLGNYNSSKDSNNLMPSDPLLPRLSEYSHFDEKDILKVLSKINNTYKLSVAEVLEFRNVLLKKLSIKELRAVLSESDGIPRADSITSIPVRKRKKRDYNSPTNRRRHFRKMSPKMLELHGLTNVLMFGSLQIGQFKAYSSLPFPNKLRFCNLTKRLLYDVQYCINGELFKSLLSINVRSIIAFYKNDLLLTLRLSQCAIAEGSYRNGMAYHPDIALQEIQSARYHHIEFLEGNSLERIITILEATRDAYNAEASNSQVCIAEQTISSVSEDLKPECSSSSSITSLPVSTAAIKCEPDTMFDDAGFMPNASWDQYHAGQSRLPVVFNTRAIYKMPELPMAQLFNDGNRDQECNQHFHGVAPVWSSYALCGPDGDYSKSINDNVAQVDSHYVFPPLPGHNLNFSEQSMFSNYMNPYEANQSANFCGDPNAVNNAVKPLTSAPVYEISLDALPESQDFLNPRDIYNPAEDIYI